jgi:phosphoribosylformimino-5-aminoimidazole carboxamide ribotide isomerase
MEDETVFGVDPLATAARWVEAGASRLHLVDLNGAFAGKPRNGETIRAIAAAYPDVLLQVGGGIRDEGTISAYLDAGVRWCIIGTQAVKNPSFVADACRRFPSSIIVGLDVRGDQVAVSGWAERSELGLIEVARRFEGHGVDAIVYTDIARDGMLMGPNIQGTKQFAESISVPVIASGGITGLDDIRALKAVAGSGIIGAITGRAIYEGTLDFSEGRRIAESE